MSGKFFVSGFLGWKKERAEKTAAVFTAPFGRNIRIGNRHVTKIVCMAGLSLLMACSSDPDEKKGSEAKTLYGQNVSFLDGFVGSVAADEPTAALVGREVLVRGGNAVDAATAIGLALSVTLPSRASLGAGGACLVSHPGEEEQDTAFEFLPVSGENRVLDNGRAVDRPAAVPMLARGLYLMQLKYGSVSFGQVVLPAYRLAKQGITVTRALSEDISYVKEALLSDEWVRKVFLRPNGQVLQVGDSLVQPHLAAVLQLISAAGVGDMYNGALSKIIVDGAQAAGGGLTPDDMRNALPVQVAALTLSPSEETTLSFLPPPADGGLGMALAFRAIEAGQHNGLAVSEGSVAAWRKAHSGQEKENSRTLQEEAQNIISSGRAATGRLPNLPASTSYVVVDRSGQAVSCALTMNNLFGTGRMAGTTGIVLAASPARKPIPLLVGAVAKRQGRFHAVIGASGQNEAAYAGALALQSALAGQHFSSTSLSEGRINAVSCSEGLPGGEESCRAVTDEKGFGMGTVTGPSH
ncbi:gamma-glutamyltransferase [Entomobacter blattae]|uniref:Gamma-glutamyltranspeptidase n=1 Tax=Entomobacter blattae TaxID=2762277 RepID=A0A7H1NQ60_9PROT|nr:gamma-glutamyltransferase [Entomobacter blattae]QNT77920.1 Gamma-glutamyltranspeptidase [Entomobacter blattae]